MTLVVRRPTYSGAWTRPNWSPTVPELACVANAVSLQMPHVEPFVVRAVRTVLDDLPEPLVGEADAYVRQEAQHHAQHRRFNDLLIDAYPSLSRVDGWAARYHARRERRGDAVSNVAFAAAIETIAFTIARWSDRHLGRFFGDADQAAAQLYLWHLAEEVEHKSVAFDVATAVGVRRRALLRAMIAATIALAFFVVAGAIPQLIRERRWYKPVAWWRLCTWAVGFAFELLPMLASAAFGDHHPDRLADPPWCRSWLAAVDPESGRLPDWIGGSGSTPSRT